MRGLFTGSLVLIALLAAGCKRTETASSGAARAEKGAIAMAMTFTSSAFDEGAMIPRKYSCDGEDVSPPLAWSGIPAGTQSLALIMDDPDAPMGTWVHWVLWGMPPSTPSLPEGVPPDAALPGGMQQGRNSFQKTGYGGPCPPAGKPHRYYFKLYALDSGVELPEQADKAALEKAMKGHIISEARLMGRYGR